jgi:ADP-heptose:LPS heptosyltransferase
VKPAENILLIRLKSIGDVIFTLPAVQAVRERFPSARLHFLVAREHAELLRGFPGIDEIIPLDRRTFSLRSPQALMRGIADLVWRLRREDFQLAIDFQGYGETEWFAYFSGAPDRWGNVYNAQRGWMYTLTSQRQPATHPVEWNLALLRAAGWEPLPVRNEYVLPEEAVAAAWAYFSAHHLSMDRPTLFLQPFTSNLEKNWPLEKFVALAHFYRERQVQIIFGGGPGDRLRLETVDDMGYCVAAGTPLLVSAGLMQLSSVVVGADTGLLHLATAMGKRVVMIMQSNHPGTCHPFQHADWAITCGEGKKIAEIAVETVIKACEPFLSEPTGNVSC